MSTDQGRDPRTDWGPYVPVSPAIWAEMIREAQALAWDQGREAERRDWELLWDLSTPDEDRQPWPNPYREAS